MGTEEPRGQLKGMDWENIGDSIHNEPSAGPVMKKRLPRKVRQIPDCYFLPRRSLPSAIAFYGAWIVAGVGAGMLAEIWINKKRMVVSFGSLTNENWKWHSKELSCIIQQTLPIGDHYLLQLVIFNH
ncbi:hypothetical protein LOK49_LG02G01395 [Camellia lanceoleosa]|uniref:Uncharacterized protein n=1 Tax=Camellia lanceoleosa TaxID=1840588 RepID=A0ACC0IHJ6_9ERIC|nr:hypothetical protein LOK49_LG02G01395 [Camellia lanceoleosa]